MAENKSLSIRTLFYSNKFVLFFSILASIILWMTITMIEAPDRDKTITNVTVAIPIENSVVSEMGLDIIGDTTDNVKVSVTVKGPNYVVSALTAQDVSVTASLANITDPGTYNLELKATKKTSQISGEYDIISVTPSVLRTSFDYIETKQFTVVPEAIGASAVEGLISENPVVTDSNNAIVTIKGPRSDMKKISKVVASATVNQTLSKTASFDADLILYDAEGNKLNKSNFTISSHDATELANFQISVPISKSKTVPIKATFTNVPAAYASTPLEHTLGYTKIDIIGPPETIDSINEITLEPIDFDLISTDNSGFNVALVLPDGIRSVDHVETVAVVFTNPSQYSVKIFAVSDIVDIHGTSNISLKRSIKNVKICGPKSVINKLKSSDLYAEIDVSGKSAGEHTVTVRIKCKTSNQIWQVGTYMASVVIQ